MTDTSREQQSTAGLDLDTDSGKLVEDGRLRTTLEDLRRRFDSEKKLKIAIEVGTDSPRVSRLLEACGYASCQVMLLCLSRRRNCGFA
jgi:hypothetical protein